MFCQECGKSIPENSKFCPKCGTLQEEVTPKHEKVNPDSENYVKEREKVSLGKENNVQEKVSLSKENYTPKREKVNLSKEDYVQNREKVNLSKDNYVQKQEKVNLSKENDSHKQERVSLSKEKSGQTGKAAIAVAEAQRLTLTAHTVPLPDTSAATAPRPEASWAAKSQPDASQPTASQPAASRAATSQTAASHSATSRPASSQSAPKQPGVSQPTTSQASVPQQDPSAKMQPGPARPMVAAGNAGKKKSNILPVVIAACLLVLCLGMGLAKVMAKPSINLNKYLTVSFEGYDTVGQAVVVFDEEQFEHDYEKKLSAIENKNSKSSGKKKSEDDYLEDFFDSYDDTSASEKFLSKYVGGDVDKKDRLSNGDRVSFKWDCDDDAALEEYGYKLKYKDEEFTVKGLEEAETFDPFDGIEVLFGGISPDGWAEISGEPRAAAARDFRYELDNRSGLSNGETVTVTCSLYYDDLIEYCISNYGVIPASLTKEYTVDGLDSYVTQLSEISPDCIDQMRRQAEDTYKANVAKNWDSSEERLNGFTYIGNYLLTSKSTDNYRGDYNALFLVYRVSVKNSYSNNKNTFDETNDFYWYIAYTNILVDPSGTNTIDIMQYFTTNDRIEIDSGISSGWYGTKSWSYYGYSTLEKLYDSVVTSNLENYYHEDDVDDSMAVTEVAKEPEAAEESRSETGEIFPDSSERLLSESEAAVLSDEDLRYAINEIYARNGYIFNDEGLKAYYSQFDWYKGTIKSSDFTMNLFNSIEKENVLTLQKERESRK